MFDLIVVGAGPAGLSCAIEAQRVGLSSIVLDKGSLVDSIRRFPTNLIWFSTPELLEIGGVPFMCATTRPTRIDVLGYYQKVAEHYKLNVASFERVDSVRRSENAFLVQTSKKRSYEGTNVVIATGYYDNPNWLDVPGEKLPKVMHYYDEPFEYVGCDVAVVGGRNSAVEAALDLYRHGARVTLIHRGEKLSDGVKYWILPDIENRIKSGEVKALFSSTVHEIREDTVAVNTPQGLLDLHNDFTFVLIGFHPDTSNLKSYGVAISSETLAPIHNERTLETNVPDLYVAGSIIAGKNNNKIFVENGRLHGAVIVSSILANRKNP
jgi:thioredoxin reductase (NADPH)